MKKLFIFLSIFLFIFSCKKKDSEPRTESTNTEVTKVLEKFYRNYGQSTKTLYDKPIAEDIFTPEIKEEIEEIVTASKKDIEKVKKSAHPDEKPFILEGSLFTSLYEGYTLYRIKSIDTRSLKPDVKVADAIVEFENDAVSPKIIWTEKVHLINSSGTEWRIDNITFDKIAPVNDLKTRLNELRNEFKQ